MSTSDGFRMEMSDAHVGWTCGLDALVARVAWMCRMDMSDGNVG